MIPRPVVRIGIDKTALKATELAASATRLARLVEIDAKRYAKEVADAGPEAFVEAIVLRAEDEDRPPNSAVKAIPGALPIQDDQVLAPTRDFAQADRRHRRRGVEGDRGLLRRCRGLRRSGRPLGPAAPLRPAAPGRARGSGPAAASPAQPRVRVRHRARAPAQPPSPSPTPSPSASPRAPVTIFEAKPVAGKDLTITLSVPLQILAERTLGRHEAGGSPGGDPSVDRGGDRRRQQRRHRRLLGGHRRPGPTGLDLQGGDDAGSAPSGPPAFVAGELSRPGWSSTASSS